MNLVPFKALRFITNDQELEEYVIARIRDNNENLLELIDNYAETRHTCGHWTYNLKSNESRKKVIAALKGEA